MPRQRKKQIRRKKGVNPISRFAKGVLEIVEQEENTPTKIKLQLFEEQTTINHHGFNYTVPVVVVAASRNEALEKLANRKFWKKTGLRPVEEFR